MDMNALVYCQLIIISDCLSDVNECSISAHDSQFHAPVEVSCWKIDGVGHQRYVLL